MGSILPYMLVENDLGAGFDVVVVVQAPLQLRLDRLRDRGMSRDDALARMAAQATDEERRALADHVLVNDGSLAHLAAGVAEVWIQITG